jgi:hypothetical protein
MKFTHYIAAAISLLTIAASSLAWANECVHSKGYWKTHSNEIGVGSLTLGSVQYDFSQFMAVLNEPARGNGLVILSQQLIAAKLNAGIATVPSEVHNAIADANALINALVTPPVGLDFLHPSLTEDIVGMLDLYNTGGFECQPILDTDGDGLQDTEEADLYLTDPNDPDTDNDNLFDGEEILIVGTDPLSSDTDADLLTDGEEVLTYGTDPVNVDTDNDGVTDGEEVLGLFPYCSGFYQTNPLNWDTDGDYYGDGGGGAGLDGHPLSDQHINCG